MTGDTEASPDVETRHRAASICVLVTDRDHHAREQLATVIDGQRDMEVVATAASAAQTVTSAARSRPDVAVVDPRLSGDLDALDLCQQLIVVSPNTRCLLHTTTVDTRWTNSAQVAAVLPKQLDHTLFLAAIRSLIGS